MLDTINTLSKSQLFQDMVKAALLSVAANMIYANDEQNREIASIYLTGKKDPSYQVSQWLAGASNAVFPNKNADTILDELSNNGNAQAELITVLNRDWSVFGVLFLDGVN